MIDRTEISRALAKAIAYKQCGKQHDAEQWAVKLIELLECAEILDPAYATARDPVDDVNYVGHKTHY